MNFVKIYTDGGCSGNQHKTNIGGWGAILKFNDQSKELYGGEFNTTNNRMEMTALLEALRSLKKANLNIQVFSDSSYLIECFRQNWYVKWQSNGWMNSKKEPVENIDLWKGLLEEVSKHNIYFFRVKGHLNINHPNTDLNKWFKKFTQWNGNDFNWEDFLNVAKMNIRADELANVGMDELRAEKQ